MISIRSRGLQCSAVIMALSSSTASSTVSLMTKVVVGVGRLELHLGPQQPLLDLVRAVGAPLGEAALQLRPAGRGDEDAHRVRPFAAHLDGALDLDVQDHVPPLVHGLVHEPLGGAIEVPHVLRVLQELVLGDPLPEGVHVQEVVVDAVDLPRPGLPRRGGHGKIQVRPGLQQGLEHRALAHAGGAGDHKGLPSPHCFTHVPLPLSLLSLPVG